MPEETLKETAATSEPPRGLISQEFFFLLQRLDRMEEKLSGEIKGLSGEIRRVDDKLSERTAKIISRTTTLIITVLLGCAGIIVTLLSR